jgi:polysaccharide biosynthesis/export protein
MSLFRFYLLGDGVMKTNNSNFVRHSLLIAILFALVATGCGGSTREIKEGRLEDLLSSEPGEDVPLESRSMMVEKIVTNLDPQVDEYRIGANDVLNIFVLEHEEVSSVRDFNKGIVGTIVKKDGKIYLPIVGPLQAAGYTIEEFHKVLADHLKNYIQAPELSVDIMKYESQKFFILGEVASPGAFPVDGDTTLLEAIGLAGGVKGTGNLESAYVIRKNTLLPINLSNLLLRGDTSRNVYMADRDLVYVPSAQDQLVYVLGEVRSPGTVKIPSGRLNLAQAIAEAGGLLPIEADRSSIKLIRGSWQEPLVYTLEFAVVLEHGDRIFLKPGDRIVVQPTSLTTASRYMQQILPFLQAADSGTAIYDRLSK